MTKVRMEREEAALRELGVTRAGARVRWLLILGFLLTIIMVPILQAWKEWRLARSENPSPFACFMSTFPRSTSAGKSAIASGFIPAVASADRLLKEGFHQFEQSLEKESVLTHRLLPRFQCLATKYLGLGNEKVILGRSNWLYYRPDIEYLTGGAFPVALGARLGGKIARAADPIPALKAFHDDLSKRGITLLLVPVPVKPMIEPEYLSMTPCGEARGLQNPSYATFVQDLRSEGVEVMDLTSLLLNRKYSNGRPQYLHRDTHWTPDAMEAVAESLAKRVSGLFPEDFQHSSLPASEMPVTVRNAGDLVGMLDLPKTSSLFPEEEVGIRPRQGSDGGHWTPDPSSPILLLGDSFARIYSAADLHWGRDAGLAERLSEHLGHDIDVLAINAGGSSSVRQSLARSIGRLDGKKVLLYEFSMRELAGGDWKLIPLPRSDTSVPKLEDTKDSLTVTGTVVEASEIPQPGTTPYRDFVRSLHLTDVEGGPTRDILVFVQAIRDRCPTGAELLRSGDRITLHLKPWAKVEESFGSFNRSELGGGASELPDVFWANDY